MQLQIKNILYTVVSIFINIINISIRKGLLLISTFVVYISALKKRIFQSKDSIEKHTSYHHVAERIETEMNLMIKK